MFIIILICLYALLGEAGANTCVAASSTKILTKLSSPSKRWAVVALARPGRTDVNKRNKLLSEMLRPYASIHNISVLVFSEKLFSQSSLQSWQDTFQGVAKVIYINTADRGFYNSEERYGYKYMCKFFSLDIYDYLKDNYDYYMRCDTDCYINKLSYDIMGWAEQNQVEYGFAMRKLEAHKPTVQSLPGWTANYMTRCGIADPAASMDVPLSTCFNFYNNWHIGKVSFFNRKDVRHYLEAVNASGHIQSHRWGDSTIQAYAVRLFMNPIHIKQVPNFRYIHGSHGNKVVSTFGNGAETNVPQRLPNWSFGNQSSTT